ncbi:MAG TPA: hypothetical protein VGM01_06840 [Ktedonobacteraceae bacterium]
MFEKRKQGDGRLRARAIPPRPQDAGLPGPISCDFSSQVLLELLC